VEGVGDAEPAVPHPLLGQPGGQCVDLDGRAGDDRGLGPVHSGDVQFVVRDPLQDTVLRSQDGEHGAPIGPLHQPGAAGDERETGGQVHHTGVQGGGDLPDAVPHHHGGLDAPGLPQRGERDFQGDQCGLGDTGLMDGVPVASVEDQVGQRRAQ
jgi:hypothetical protein